MESITFLEFFESMPYMFMFISAEKKKNQYIQSIYPSTVDAYAAEQANKQATSEPSTKTRWKLVKPSTVPRTQTGKGIGTVPTIMQPTNIHTLLAHVISPEGTRSRWWRSSGSFHSHADA